MLALQRRGSCVGRRRRRFQPLRIRILLPASSASSSPSSPSPSPALVFVLVGFRRIAGDQRTSGGAVAPPGVRGRRRRSGRSRVSGQNDRNALLDEGVAVFEGEFASSTIASSLQQNADEHGDYEEDGDHHDDGNDEGEQVVQRGVGGSRRGV